MPAAHTCGSYVVVERERNVLSLFFWLVSTSRTDADMPALRSSFDPEGVYPTTRSVRTSTVLSSLLAETQLKKLMLHRPTSRQTVTRLLTKAHQQQQQHRIWRRRFTSQLRSYFGISARDALI
eukprot:PhM_4_TR14177/c1_g1_i1/m.47465